MTRGRLAMLLDRLLPSRCRGAGDALRHASNLHAVSTLAIGAEARKMEQRANDMRVTADAAEARERHRDEQLDTLNRLLARDR